MVAVVAVVAAAGAVVAVAVGLVVVVVDTIAAVVTVMASLHRAAIGARAGAGPSAHTKTCASA